MGRLPLARTAAARLARAPPGPAARDVGVRVAVLHRRGRRHLAPERSGTAAFGAGLHGVGHHDPGGQRFESVVALASGLPPAGLSWLPTPRARQEGRRKSEIRYPKSEWL